MKPLPSLTDDELAALARRAAALPDAPAALVQRAIAAWSPAPSVSQGNLALPLSLIPAGDGPLRPALGRSQAAAAVLQAGARAVLRQLAAVLTFDSWAASPLAAGLRGARQPTRQLLFSAEGRDVDLRISAAEEDNRFVLTGQVFGPDDAGVARLRAQSGDPTAPAAPEQLGPLDEMGEFRLPAVAAGRYVLSLQLGDAEIVLPPIELGAVAG
jgi:hypothetical protein